MEGILNLIVRQNVKGGEERRLLLLHDHLFPQPRILLQPRLSTSHAVTVNQLSSHTAEHQARHHPHSRRADAESLASLHLVVILHRLQAHTLQPLPASRLQLRQHHLASHQGQQMGYLTDALTLLVGQHMQILRQRLKRVVGRTRQGYSALKAVRIVGHHTIQRIRRAAHHHIPQQPVYMHVHGIRTPRLTLIARAVVSLTEHHGEVAHGRTPFLRHRVCLRRKRESMLAVRVGKTFGKVGNGIVERQAAHRQLRLLRLLLLVLRSTLLGTPLVLLLLIHPVHRLHLSRPSLHHRVDAALARGKVAGDVGYKVQRVHLSMHVHSHPRRQHTYHRADGGQHGQRQSRTHSVNGVLHALRHSWQRLVIEEVVLSQRLVYAVRLALFRTAARHALLTYGNEHVLQPLRHLRALLAQRIVNTGQLLRLREAVIARNNPIEQPTVEAADMTKIHGQLKRKRIAVALHRLLRVIIHRPPLAHNFSIRNAQITVRSLRRRSLRRISQIRNPSLPSCLRQIRKIRNLLLQSCLPIVKQLLVHEQQPVRRRRKEHTRDVLRPLVILHAQQLRSPS